MSTRDIRQAMEICRTYGGIKVVTTAEYYVHRTSTHCSVVVTFNGVAIDDNTALSKGSVLTITATADSGYTMSSLTVNGEAHTSGQSITVSGDVVIVAVATETPTPSWTELWTGTVEFEEDEEESGVIYASPDRGESTMISHIFNTTDDYKVEITDLSLSVEGKFVAGEGGTCELGDYNLVTTDIDFSVANVEMYSASFFNCMYAKSSSVGEHTVKIYKKVTE